MTVVELRNSLSDHSYAQYDLQMYKLNPDRRELICQNPNWDKETARDKQLCSTCSARLTNMGPSWDDTNILEPAHNKIYNKTCVKGRKV